MLTRLVAQNTHIVYKVFNAVPSAQEFLLRRARVVERLLYREATAQDLPNSTATFSVTSGCLRAVTNISALVNSERFRRTRLN